MNNKINSTVSNNVLADRLLAKLLYKSVPNLVNENGPYVDTIYDSRDIGIILQDLEIKLRKS